MVDKFEQPKLPGLSDPNNAATPTEGNSCEAANKEIVSVVRKSSASCSKRGPYARYSPEERFAMAKYASLHGLAAASRHFSEKFGSNVNYTTVQSMVAQYKKNLGKFSDPAGLESLPHEPRGRSTALPSDIDDLVCRHLRTIRSVGGVISRRITIDTTNRA